MLVGGNAQSQQLIRGKDLQDHSYHLYPLLLDPFPDVCYHVSLASASGGTLGLKLFGRTLITLTLSVSVDSIGDLNGLGFRLC